MTPVQYYKQMLRQTKPWLIQVSKWFGIAAAVGVLTFFLTPDLLEQILGVFEDKFGIDPALDNDLVYGIFWNNLQSSAIALVGGLALGFGPFLLVGVNGFILGYILISILFLANPDQVGVSLLALLVGIVPHGILEIPAFLLAAALGLRLGIEWLKTSSYKRRAQVFAQSAKAALAGIPLIVLMMYLAAFVEVYVSGRLLEFFVG